METRSQLTQRKSRSEQKRKEHPSIQRSLNKRGRQHTCGSAGVLVGWENVRQEKEINPMSFRK